MKEKGKHPDQILKAKLGATTTAKPKSSSNPTSNSTNPTNQYTKSAIKDELQIERYLFNLIDDRPEAANKLLTNSLYGEIKDHIDINIEDCEQFVRPLTNTLRTYIIQNISDYGVLSNTVRNVIYKNILEYIDKSSR